MHRTTRNSLSSPSSQLGSARRRSVLSLSDSSVRVAGQASSAPERVSEARTTIRRKMAAAANVAPENQYFYEDVVYRVDKRGNVVFGIVMENDDHDMSEESTDSEESMPKRKKGEIRMIWHPSGIEELVNYKKVREHVCRDRSPSLSPYLAVGLIFGDVPTYP